MKKYKIAAVKMINDGGEMVQVRGLLPVCPRVLDG